MPITCDQCTKTPLNEHAYFMREVIKEASKTASLTAKHPYDDALNKPDYDVAWQELALQKDVIYKKCCRVCIMRTSPIDEVAAWCAYTNKQKVPGFDMDDYVQIDMNRSVPRHYSSINADHYEQ